MHNYNVESKIKIVGVIANLAADVNTRLDRKELAIILKLFGQKNYNGEEYLDTSKLIKKALDHYAEIDETTADNITVAYVR